jgi:hypothetical protein
LNKKKFTKARGCPKRMKKNDFVIASPAEQGVAIP